MGNVIYLTEFAVDGLAQILKHMQKSPAGISPGTGYG